MFLWLVEGARFVESASDDVDIEVFVLKYFVLKAGLLLLFFCNEIGVEDAYVSIVGDFSNFNFDCRVTVATPLVSLVLMVVVVKGR